MVVHLKLHLPEGVYHSYNSLEVRLNIMFGGDFTPNIPILPIGILDYCKQKLSAPPMVLGYF